MTPMCFVNFGHTVLESALTLIVPLFVINDLHENEHMAGNLFAVVALATCLSYPISGEIAQRTSAEFNMLIGVIARTLCLLGLLFFLFCVCVCVCMCFPSQENVNSKN